MPSIGESVGENSARCRWCGGDIPPPTRRRGRPATKYCSAACRKAMRKPTGSCVRCGDSALGGRSYCSDECRWPRRITTPVACRRCGKKFIRSSRWNACCSPECAKKAPRGNKAREYRCLYCEKTFRRKRYPGGSVSCGVKYCSRECAFRARREKKPCAVRPLEVEAKCRRELMWWRKQRSRMIEAESLRWAPARSPRAVAALGSRMCRGCHAAEVAARKRLCSSCFRERARASRRKQRKRHRQRHGGDNYRQRCRRFGAPYTAIKKSRIYDRDNWVCQICGADLLRKYLRTSAGVDPRSPTLDHIIPLCLGPDGPGHIESNVQAACWECNTRRGATPIDSFAPGSSHRLP